MSIEKNGGNNVAEDYILVRRCYYEALLKMIGRVQAVMDLVENDSFISITGLCHMLGRPDIAEKIEEGEKVEREAYIKWVTGGEEDETEKADS